MRLPLRPRNDRDVDRAIAAIRDTSARARKAYTVTIERPRSTEQNARLWAAYKAIQDQRLQTTGELWPVEDIHEHLKRRILGIRQSAFGDAIPESTARLSVDAMQQYTDHVQRIAADEWGIVWDW